MNSEDIKGDSTSDFVACDLPAQPPKYTKCIDCGKPFSAANVFTRDGAKETQISGVCEKCFDTLFDDEDVPEESEYCMCNLEPTIEEADTNQCDCCGRAFS